MSEARLLANGIAIAETERVFGPFSVFTGSGWNYSCLVAEFHMRRAIGFHLVQSYLPTTLIVVISWVSFWMDVDSVPGRTTLGVTTLLTVSSKSSVYFSETLIFFLLKSAEAHSSILNLKHFPWRGAFMPAKTFRANDDPEVDKFAPDLIASWHR
ncbi:ligand-gated ion channel 50-like, partial [Penaeus japonicus]|uniref:ligand-gated ion channel 50-like n=1 Tax=Penaeus japonicus TaxID=27405 RepID=UPI001C715EFA